MVLAEDGLSPVKYAPGPGAYPDWDKSILLPLPNLELGLFITVDLLSYAPGPGVFLTYIKSPAIVLDAKE